MRGCWFLWAFMTALPLWGQDLFEIHVYEYEPLSWRQYTLEAHLNFIAQGTAEREGTLLPTRHQTHLTWEPTFGVTENFALGFMFLNAWEPGYTPQFAGWRILPHLYAPQSWGLPVRIGFVGEFSFQKTRYEENSRRVELRPIIDREFTRWQLVFNPVFERALHGPGTARGWNFEPALLLRWKREPFSPSLEYYGQAEDVFFSSGKNPDAQRQVHRLFGGGDWRLRDGFHINIGVGFNLAGPGPGIVLKSRLEWEWGKRDKH